MKELDEEIIELRRKKKEAEFQDISKGVYINNEMFEFKQQVIYEDKMSIMLPVNFVSMPEKMAKIKYPSESRPQIIKTDYSGAVNFTFNLFDTAICPNQIQGACDTMKKIIKNMNPAYIFYEQKTEECRNTVCSFFDYKSYAMDAHVYNLVYVTSIGGKVMQGTFNCRFQDMEQWKNAAIQVKNSILDLTEEKVP